MSPLVVAMPGTGFDSFFAQECFQSFAETLGYECLAMQPDPLNLVESMWQSMTNVLTERDVILAGISISAAIAVKFAHKAFHPSTNSLSSSSSHSILAIIAALPAWTGKNLTLSSAPAQISAQQTAQNIQKYGIETSIVQMENTTPLWLSQHLTRSWSHFGENLTNLCLAAASYDGPTVEELQELQIPLITIGLCDDPIHPATIAQEWARIAPYGIYQQTSLQNISQNLAEFSLQTLSGFAELERQGMLQRKSQKNSPRIPRY